MIKRVIKDAYFSIPWSARGEADFVRRLRYRPSRRPVSFNSKIHIRKKRWSDERFVTCADKAAVKHYVSERIGPEHIIPTLYCGDLPTVELLLSLLRTHGDAVVKTTHGSGSTYFLDASASAASVEATLHKLRRDLKVDYGRLYGEGWYSKVDRKVIIEPWLLRGSDLKDYKFHVFGGDRVVLQLDYDRFSNHGRSFFDVDLNYLPLQLHYPSRADSIEPPPNYKDMVAAARRLGSEFTYARVDFYSFGGTFLFGEITFAPGGGLERFNPETFDNLFGEWWPGDPAQ